MIFAIFVLATAGLTGALISQLKRWQDHSKIAVGLTCAGLLASGILGFNTEELVLVCLPLILGCLVLSNSVLGRKKVESMYQDEKVQASEV
jgi:CHASE2 domain-containing sensor protein